MTMVMKLLLSAISFLWQDMIIKSVFLMKENTSNSDAKEFGGSGITAESMKSVSYIMHGFDDSISIDIAPLSVIYLKYVPKKKTVEKILEKKTEKGPEKASVKKHTKHRVIKTTKCNWLCIFFN